MNSDPTVNSYDVGRRASARPFRNPPTRPHRVSILSSFDKTVDFYTRVPWVTCVDKLDSGPSLVFPKDSNGCVGPVFLPMAAITRFPRHGPSSFRGGLGARRLG